jgi:alpha-L-fucosidase
MKTLPLRRRFFAISIWVFATVAPFVQAQSNKDQAADLSQVPQMHETIEQRDARMQWFRDAKLGMFIHWGPCTVGDREIGWGRHANRPWDINQHGLRTSDPDYDNYYRRFNPVKYDADAWVRLAQEAGMKYMVLIAKHHDGFAQFDSKLTDYTIMQTPYGKDIMKQFVDACHKHGMRVGLYYSTRDWESCMILSPTPQGDGWSHRSSGKTRPLEECIRMLASIASGGGNLLLNFGPDQFGEFRPEEVAIARGMGAWLKKYGIAIYGTRGGPFTNGKWGGSTHRGNTVYVQVFD